MKLLVGYDASKASEKALQLARVHAKAFSASVSIVTSLSKTRNEKDLQTVEEAENALAEAKSIFDKEGIACDTHVLIRGVTPGEDLVQYVEDHNVDELLVGVKRTSKVGKLVMGSTAQYVVLKSPCPVVSVRP